MASQGNKKRDISSANLADWVQKLRDELRHEIAPNGWYSINEIIELTKVSRTSLQDKLRDKKIERKRFKPRNGGRPSMHYKMQ
jgi:hypothetical protein